MAHWRVLWRPRNTPVHTVGAVRFGHGDFSSLAATVEESAREASWPENWSLCCIAVTIGPITSAKPGASYRLAARISQFGNPKPIRNAFGIYPRDLTNVPTPIVLGASCIAPSRPMILNKSLLLNIVNVRRCATQADTGQLGKGQVGMVQFGTNQVEQRGAFPFRAARIAFRGPARILANNSFFCAAAERGCNTAPV